MTEPIEVEVAKHQEEGIQRELFGTRIGFVLAAVGSAVGLGNMWRFSYVASDQGGAAFVFLYVVLTLGIGIPIMLAEFILGRRGRLSPIGAIRKAGGKLWAPMGLLFVLAGFLILSYYSVIAGWAVRYGIEAILSGFPADAGAHFDAISTGTSAIVYHLVFMAVTISIVMIGIEKGIEKVGLVLMPALFILLVGLAFWAFTLDGAAEGYAFYLSPDWSAVFNMEIFAGAAAQAFFSLSLGMGAMLTFASYLSKHENLNREAVVISFSDFGVAFIAGLVVFPIVFALGMQDDVGASAIGALFISLPGGFAEMGGVGRVVGTLFFAALVVGALTSAISLLEVVVASIIDEFKIQRKTAALGAGIIIALIGILSATDLNIMTVVDKVAGEFFLVIGGLGTAILVGWVMKNPQQELLDGASPGFVKVIPVVFFFLRFVVPLVVAFVVWHIGGQAVDVIRTTFGG